MVSVVQGSERKVSGEGCVMIAGGRHAFKGSVWMEAGKDTGTADNDLLVVRGSSTWNLHVVRLSKTHACPSATTKQHVRRGAVTNCTM
jgi:hypothetical protein